MIISLQILQIITILKSSTLYDSMEFSKKQRSSDVLKIVSELIAVNKDRHLDFSNRTTSIKLLSK